LFLSHAKQDYNDLDHAEPDKIAVEFTSAIELDQLRAEIAALVAEEIVFNNSYPSQTCSTLS
jgi:hypothetical protein